MPICFPVRSRRARGVALVIVLAFVVLLTGLVVAFFSRAISERQVSNSSANAVRVDLFTQDAVATTLGDLRQEIAAGSTVAAPSPAANPVVYLYKPKAAVTAVPCPTGVSGTALANLLKRSANNTPFFTGGNYDTSNFPPSNRAANSSSTSAAVNGRIISPARWNKPLLLPKQNAGSDTDATPVTSAFNAPDWIVVARDGSNPTAWNSVLATNGTNPAIGRYAYNIYDEGGILDMNAAGYPDVSGLSTVPQGKDPTYKPSLAFADLKQLPGISDLPAARQEQIIRTLVGWRNYASSAIDLTATTPTAGVPISGGVNVSPGYTWSSGAGGNVLNYLNFLRFTNATFLSPANRLVVNNQSDRSFASRQQLMHLLLDSIADQTSGGKAERAALQNALQYLGTFSRGLNQPSYAPVSRVVSADNPNPRPTILASVAGGNNVADTGAYPGAAQQDAFSPDFLTIRARSAFARADGTSAVVGEPLVKKRFALQRLAWLTYKGPSVNRSPSDVDMATLIANGVSPAFLKLGTDENILKYFGLKWDVNAHLWRYAGHNRPTGGVGDTITGAIHRLDEVAALSSPGREPDFFELLKASVDPASVAKASIQGPVLDPTKSDPDGPLAALNFQYTRDISLDAAIIQLGANIIDQFDTDGYPTHIIFNDGSGKPEREFRGVENLPYIYRIHPGIIKARDSVPTSVGTDTKTAVLHSDNTGAPHPDTSLTDTGVGVLLAVPDLWNPHDQNSSLGNPRPGVNAASLRVIANSAAPDYITAGTANSLMIGGFIHPDAYLPYQGVSYTTAILPTATLGGAPLVPSSVTPNAPYFSRTPTTATNSMGTPMRGTNPDPTSFSNFGYTVSQVIDSATTSSSLVFNAPDATIFREPTLLGTTNVAGSGLSMIISNPDITGLLDSSSQPVYPTTGGSLGLTSIATVNPFSSAGGVASSSVLYTGIYLGAYPLRYVSTRYPNSDRTWTGCVYTTRNPSISANPINGVTYSVQYKDESGTWVTYDEKYVNTNVAWANAQGGLVQPTVMNNTFVDPRTARFGAPQEIFQIYDKYHYRGPAYGPQWLPPVAGTTMSYVSQTERPDYHSGSGSNFRGNYTGGGSDWATYTAPGWHYSNIGTATAVNDVFFRTGLFGQNNPYWTSDIYKYSGDPRPLQAPATAPDAQFYTDADGVVRRAMGGHIPLSSNNSGANPTAWPGQPLATASVVDINGRATATVQSASRPKMLNRPFRSVAELGCVFSGTPWKNLDFSSAESGYAGLLDVFCVNDSDDAGGLVAGRLDLNTRQSAVLKAVLTGAYTTEGSGTPTTLTADDAALVANLLITRTSQQPAAGPNTNNGPQPLTNIGELVGRWNSRKTITNTNYTPALSTNHNIDGSLSYDGFSADLDTLPTTNAVNNPISAQRETVVRAFAGVGNTRVWNLLIDIVAQTGRYPASATNINNFAVEGEQRCWLHVAIDRYTGAVIDSKLEIVKE